MLPRIAMKAIRDGERCTDWLGEAASKKVISESPHNLVLVIPAPHASVSSERIMMTRYKSKRGAGDAPRRTPVSGESLPTPARHSCRVENTLTHWKQRIGAHSTRHTFGLMNSSFSRRRPKHPDTGLRPGFAGISTSDYNEELGIIRAGRRPPILKRLKTTADNHGR